MQNPLATLCALALTSAVAHAQTWLPPQPVGARWTYETRVSPHVPGFGHGDRAEVAVDAVFGDWQHYTDFGGFGPLWVNPRPDETVAVWTDLGPALLADFADEPGSRRTLEINGRTVEASLYRSPHDPDLRTLSIWLHPEPHADPSRASYSRTLSFRRGEGLVSWNDDKPGYDYGYYLIFVTTSRLPGVPADLDVPVPSNTHQVVRSADGRSLLAVAGERLVVIDLATGGERELALGAGIHAYRVVSQGVWYHSDWVTLQAWSPQGEVRVSVDLGTMRVLDPQPSAGWQVGALRLRRVGHELELLGVPRSGQPLPRFPLAGGLLGELLLKDGLLLIPYAYPGSLMVIDPLTGALLDHIVEPGIWLTEVELLGRSVFAGQQRLDLDTRQWEVFTSENLRDTLVRGDRLWALTDTHLLAFDAAGAEVGRHRLPADVAADLGTIFDRVVGLVDVQDGRALIATQARVRSVTWPVSRADTH